MFPKEKLLKHLRQGTLGAALRKAVRGMPEHVKVRWLGAENPEQAVRALAQWGQVFTNRSTHPKSFVLSIGDGDEFHQALNRHLKQAGVRFKMASVTDIDSWPREQVEGLAGILCGASEAREITRLARALTSHAALSEAPFEYAAGLDIEKTQFAQRDEYRDTFFVSPVLLDQPGPYAIYEESLQKFEQKCGLRDFLDLYQVLSHIVRNQVPGDIAEFGSYKGHSGWLIARSLEALGSSKQLYLFDTFEGFPQEHGLDHFWAHTHKVDFESIRAQFAGRSNVHLVRGDFTQTLTERNLGSLALAYVDCDSHRATRWLIDYLWPARIEKGGAMVFEDYGHPALLGNRVAVHDGLKPGHGFQFFSQFSGLYMALKY